MTDDNRKEQAPNSPSAESQVLKELEALAASPGFIYSLAHAVIANSYFVSDALPHAMDRLTVQELTLAAAFAARRPLNDAQVPSEVELNAQIGEIYALLGRVHDVAKQRLEAAGAVETHTARRFSADRRYEPADPPRGEEMVEPLNYAGMGSFDFQHLELAPEKYSQDTNWLESNVGLSIDSLVGIAKELQDLREHRLAPFFLASTTQERCRAALDALSFTRDELSSVTKAEFNSFLDRFSVTPGKLTLPVNTVGDLNDLEINPIIRLAEDRFFMPVGFMLAKSIYESPFYWMLKDNRYSVAAGDHRGDATEAIAHQLFMSVFGDRVYKDVKIVDGKQTAHQIDVLVIEGNRALVVEAKAKRLTALARKGADENLKKDFSQAVQEAYGQARASRGRLLTGGCIVLASDGSPIELPASLEEVLVVCLTLDHIPALPYLVDQFLEKAPNDPYPVVMSVFGLDLLATYLRDPLQFMHYIHQRAVWSDRFLATWEGPLLAFYLKYGLALPQESVRMVLNENSSVDLEVHFMSARGRYDLLTKLYANDDTDAAIGELTTRWQEGDLDDLYALLKGSSEPWAINALFMLFDQPENSLNEFLEAAKESVQFCRDSRDLTFCEFPFGRGKGATFACFPDATSTNEEMLSILTSALKHKNKADQWVGFGATLDAPGMGAVFADKPWRASFEMDVSVQRFLQPNEPALELDRKEPCWCGSDDVYSECHAEGI